MHRSVHVNIPQPLSLKAVPVRQVKHKSCRHAQRNAYAVYILLGTTVGVSCSKNGSVRGFYCSSAGEYSSVMPLSSELILVFSSCAGQHRCISARSCVSIQNYCWFDVLSVRKLANSQITYISFFKWLFESKFLQNGLQLLSSGNKAAKFPEMLT